MNETDFYRSNGNATLNEVEALEARVRQLSDAQKRILYDQEAMMVRLIELKKSGGDIIIFEILDELTKVTNRDMVRSRRDPSAVQERISDINSIERVRTFVESGDANIDLFKALKNKEQQGEN